MEKKERWYGIMNRLLMYHNEFKHGLANEDELVILYDGINDYYKDLTDKEKFNLFDILSTMGRKSPLLTIKYNDLMNNNLEVYINSEFNKFNKMVWSTRARQTKEEVFQQIDKLSEMVGKIKLFCKLQNHITQDHKEWFNYTKHIRENGLEVPKVEKMVQWFNQVNKTWDYDNDSERESTLNFLHQYQNNNEFKNYHKVVKVKLREPITTAYKQYKRVMGE